MYIYIYIYIYLSLSLSVSLSLSIYIYIYILEDPDVGPPERHGADGHAQEQVRAQAPNSSKHV